MTFTCALLFAWSAAAIAPLRIDKHAATAVICQKILARDRFDLDDAIARDLVEPLAPDLYTFPGSDIDPREVSALNRLLAAQGGRALAIGTFASQRGMPVVDAIHYAADGGRRLLSIKTSIGGRTDGIGFIRGKLFRHTITDSRLFSKEGLASQYRIDRTLRDEKDRFRRDIVTTILRIWGLDETPTPRVTFLLDLSAATGLTPVLRSQAEIFPESTAVLARKDDTVLMTPHEGRSEDHLPRVFNLDQFIRKLNTDQHLAGAIILFRDHVLEMNQTAFTMRRLPEFALTDALQSPARRPPDSPSPATPPTLGRRATDLAEDRRP